MAKCLRLLTWCEGMPFVYAYLSSYRVHFNCSCRTQFCCDHRGLIIWLDPKSWKLLRCLSLLLWASGSQMHCHFLHCPHCKDVEVKRDIFRVQVILSLCFVHFSDLCLMCSAYRRSIFYLWTPNATRWRYQLIFIKSLIVPLLWHWF